MSRRSSQQMHLPFGLLPTEVGKPTASANTAAAEMGSRRSAPDELLRAAIADPLRESGFLPLAEDAVRASPGDGHILLLAATAALLDRDHERSLKFLKRFAKHLGAVEKTMGALLVLAGIAFLTGLHQTFSYWLLETFPVFTQIG